jgi:hypothetical protein
VVGGASSLLSRRRLAAFGVLAVALAVYFSVHESLWTASTAWDVVWMAFVLIPPVFSMVWFALPLWNYPRVWLIGLAFVPLAVLFDSLGVDGAGSWCKLAAATFLAWWFLTLFESVSWVVLVAAIVPWVDTFSVFKGPTNVIVKHHNSVFDHLSFAFPVPGQDATANLGIPDLVFFALFLGAAVRWGLRPFWTWLLMVASFGLTITLAVWLNIGGLHGLPALPFLSLAFFLANGDLIWKQMRADRETRPVQT